MLLQLAGDVVLDTERAVALLADYPPETLDAYDAGPSSGLDRVGPAEIGRLIVIEPLSQAVARALVKAAADAPWHLVPADARLADADPEGDLYWRAAELYGHFTRLHGVGDAIASKLLHLKRPAFFPILDALIREAYDLGAQAAYEQGERCRRQLPHADRLYWAAIRADLVRPSNAPAFADLREALLLSGELHKQRLARVSDVRLMDMIVWRNRVGDGLSVP
ncbi:MAG: DUF6308 family protein [Actinomycetota bacterium]|nr:DUF6308 family protein [Actinomycetota bacterium]